MSTPSMTLFSHVTSPFGRKVLVLLHETGQQQRVTLHPVTLSPTAPDDTFNQANPLGKVPALQLADGSVIHDSRVILDYLDQQHVGNPLIPPGGSARWRRLTLASTADGIMDAAVLIRYERGLRPAQKQWQAWMTAQSDKVLRALASLEQNAMAELASHFDIAAISLACALAYLDLRLPDLDWRTPNPQLTAWYAEVGQRPSMLATRPV
ncbi:glutathione S-transferase [Pseudomonas lundensis]|uniref:glutathione S-transferase family protein n=1 Tax=Pseudomonas lundensis TaxID=86185 RepID=UPI000BA1CD92|nr:glutathione S-transferase family protein [Pseudomonas lundensis]OZY37580.1 glutathione S-transferase [Pseudomonas lundensis]